MLIYYILIGYIIIVALLFRINRRKKYFFLVFVPLWLLMGLRYGVGADYFSYKEIFENVAADYFIQYHFLEKGYLLLNVLVSQFTSNSMYIFLATSFIVVYFFVKSIWDSSENITLSIILFITLGYYFNAMNGVRQFMAIAISFYAMKYLNRNKVFQYCIFIMVASLFHISVLILIPLCLAVVKMGNKKFYLFTIIGFAVIKFYGVVFTNWLAEINSFTSKYVLFNITINRVSIPNIALAAASFTGGYYTYCKSHRDRDLDVYLKYNWIALLCFVFLSQWGIATTRIAFYCTPVYLLIIPKVINRLKSWENRLYINVALTAIGGVYLITVLNNSVKTGNNFIPYVCAL